MSKMTEGKAINILYYIKTLVRKTSVYCDAIDFAIDAIRKNEAKGWTKVEDEFPPISTPVLTINAGGTISIMSLEDNSLEYVWEDENGYWHDIDEVESWQLKR